MIKIHYMVGPCPADQGYIHFTESSSVLVDKIKKQWLFSINEENKDANNFLFVNVKDAQYCFLYGFVDEVLTEAKVTKNSVLARSLLHREKLAHNNVDYLYAYNSLLWLRHVFTIRLSKPTSQDLRLVETGRRTILKKMAMNGLSISPAVISSIEILGKSLNILNTRRS